MPDLKTAAQAVVDAYDTLAVVEMANALGKLRAALAAEPAPSVDALTQARREERERCAKRMDLMAEKVLLSQSGDDGGLSNVMLRQIAICGFEQGAAEIRSLGDQQ